MNYNLVILKKIVYVFNYFIFNNKCYYVRLYFWEDINININICFFLLFTFIFNNFSRRLKVFFSMLIKYVMVDFKIIRFIFGFIYVIKNFM